MSKNKLLGKTVKVTFLDHSENIPGAVRCELYGIVSKNSRKVMEVTCWDLLNVEDDVRRDNCKTFSIVKSTIEKIEYLGVSETKDFRTKKKKSKKTADKAPTSLIRGQISVVS